MDTTIEAVKMLLLINLWVISVREVDLVCA